MNPTEVILIFDIGKTTKKAILFDKSFHVIEEKTETFREIPDDDGFPSDDLPRVSAWIVDTMYHYTNHPKFRITHCNFSAYGASLVHLDHSGEPATPFYNYLKPFPDEVKQSFSSRYGAVSDLSVQTASPFFGLLNSGLQLYWLKHSKSKQFSSLTSTLHLPQYFTFLISGRYFSDITSVGCHTMLWDFANNKYHDWVFKENLINLLAPIQKTDKTFPIQFNKQQLKLGVGVHDSSAALMPYLVSQSEPFLLLSTGTWNICFNPSNQDPLTQNELLLDCLCYLKYDGQPVKASRIFLGREHEIQTEQLAKHFGAAKDEYSKIAFDENLYRELKSTADKNKAFVPVAMEGTGPLPQKQKEKTNLGAFQNYKEAYHQLMYYLVTWQLLSINLIDPLKNIKNVIVVGGFTKNEMFLELLKREDPERQVSISDHPRASALGAAWLASEKQLYDGKGDLLKIIRR